MINKKGEVMAKKNLILINVLASDIYNDCHIAGSINVPYQKLEEHLKDINKDALIVVYCASYKCPLSKKAWKKLHDLGFNNSYAYEGGMAEWYQRGYPYEGGCRLPYLQESYLKPEEEKEVRTIAAPELKRLMN